MKWRGRADRGRWAAGERLALGVTLAASAVLLVRGDAGLDQSRREVNRPDSAVPPAATAGPNRYGYFPLPMVTTRLEPCGHQAVLTLYDDPGRWHDWLLSVEVDGAHCHLGLVTHKLITGMAAVEQWTYASIDVPVLGVLGQDGELVGLRVAGQP